MYCKVIFIKYTLKQIKHSKTYSHFRQPDPIQAFHISITFKKLLHERKKHSPYIVHKIKRNPLIIIKKESLMTSIGDQLTFSKKQPGSLRIEQMV